MCSFLKCDEIGMETIKTCISEDLEIRGTSDEIRCHKLYFKKYHIFQGNLLCPVIRLATGIVSIVSSILVKPEQFICRILAPQPPDNWMLAGYLKDPMAGFHRNFKVYIGWPLAQLDKFLQPCN